MMDYYYSVVRILEDLVAFETVSATGNLDLIEYVETYLQAHGIASIRLPDDEDPKRCALLACIGDEDASGVVLSGHTDVVPADHQNWRTSPFVLTEDKGRFYARGCADMKSFIAVALACVPYWLKCEIRLPIILALSYDEEIGCLASPRIAEALKHYFPATKRLIVGEPSSMNLIVAHKGIINIRTEVSGVPCHSSCIGQGVSAVHVAALLLAEIEDLMNDFQCEGRLNSLFTVPFSSLHVGRICGGEGINMMAARCHFDWEIRFLPEDGFDWVFQRVKEKWARRLDQIIKDFPDLRIENKLLTRVIPGLGNYDNQDVLALCRLIFQQGRQEQGVSFTAEAGDYQQAGFSTLICGPGNIAQAHQPNEYIEAEQLLQAIRFMQALPNALEKSSV